jgi:hypothetical protein
MSYPFYDYLLAGLCVSSAFAIPSAIQLLQYEKIVPSIFICVWSGIVVYFLFKYVL